MDILLVVGAQDMAAAVPGTHKGPRGVPEKRKRHFISRLLTQNSPPPPSFPVRSFLRLPRLLRLRDAEKFFKVVAMLSISQTVNNVARFDGVSPPSTAAREDQISTTFAYMYTHIQAAGAFTASFVLFVTPRHFLALSPSHRLHRFAAARVCVPHNTHREQLIRQGEREKSSHLIIS